jgi:hypothetical protein
MVYAYAVRCTLTGVYPQRDSELCLTQLLQTAQHAANHTLLTTDAVTAAAVLASLVYQEECRQSLQQKEGLLPL